jgi:hypothetical protein
MQTDDHSEFLIVGLDRWTFIWFLVVLLFVLALRSIWRSKPHSRKAKIFWTIIALIPVLGPAAWFVAGSQRQKHRV